MKNLICADDIIKAAKAGIQTVYIDNNTIITPSAKDEAEKANIFLSYSEQGSETANDSEGESLYYKALKAIAAKGNFGELLQALSQVVGAPFISLSDKSGSLKHIIGRTIALKPKKANCNALLYSELVSKEDKCSMQTGFIELSGNNIEWDTQCDEVFHIVHGTVIVDKGDENFTAHQGDVLTFKRATCVKLSTEGTAKIFYVKQAK